MPPRKDLEPQPIPLLRVRSPGAPDGRADARQGKDGILKPRQDEERPGCRQRQDPFQVTALILPDLER